jgi:hypothetical protein
VAAAPGQAASGRLPRGGVLDDALIKNLDVERYEDLRSQGPVWNLQEQTKDLSLDHFMCFSSMALSATRLGQLLRRERIR